MILAVNASTRHCFADPVMGHIDGLSRARPIGTSGRLPCSRVDREIANQGQVVRILNGGNVEPGHLEAGAYEQYRRKIPMLIPFLPGTQ